MTGMLDDRRDLVAAVLGTGALVPTVRRALDDATPGLARAFCIVPRVPDPAPLGELDDGRLDREVGDALVDALTRAQDAVGALPDGGRLVFVLPHAPLMGIAGGTAASAVTNGVLSLARTLAIELARDAVTVNVVALDAHAPSVPALTAALDALLGAGGADVTGQEIYLTAGTDLGRLRP